MNTDKCRQRQSFQASRRNRSSVCQHEGTKTAPAKTPSSHKTNTEAAASLTRGQQIVAPQNKGMVTRSESGNSQPIDSQSEHKNTRRDSVSRKTRNRPRRDSMNRKTRNRPRSDSMNRKTRNRPRSDSMNRKTQNRPRSDSMNRKTQNRPRSDSMNRKTQNRPRSDSMNRKTQNRPRSDSMNRKTQNRPRSDSMNRKTQNRPRSDSVNRKTQNRPRSDSVSRKTNGKQSEDTKTRGSSRKSKSGRHRGEHMEANSTTISSTSDLLSQTQGQSVTRATPGPPDQTSSSGSRRQTVDTSVAGGATTKVAHIKRKHHGSESETNCTSNRSSLKMKAENMSPHNKQDCRTLEHSSLEEGEIIEAGSLPPARYPAYKKRRRRSYKARESESMTTVTFMDKVEIVDLQQGGNSVREGKAGHKLKKQASTGGHRQGSGQTAASDSCRKAPHGDSCRSGTVSRSQVDTCRSVTFNKSQVDTCRSGTVNRSQVDSCRPAVVDGSQVVNVKRLESDQGDESTAMAAALEEGEILSDSDIPGDLSTNELLPQSGSDMSISSEDSLTEETVPRRQLKDSCFLNSEGSSDKMVTSNFLSSPAAGSAGSNLDPLATVFVPRCLTSGVPDPAHQPSMPYSQPWPTFSAQSHFTQQQYWPKCQTPVHMPQTQKLNSDIAYGFNPYSDPNRSFPAPSDGMFSSVSSIWSYLQVPQQQSQWTRVPSLQPPWSALPESDKRATSSRGEESSGPRPGRRIHVHPTAAHTCPEITNTCRCWQTVTQSDKQTVRQADVEVGGMELKVMCYNILSQELMDRHMYLYTRCRDTDLQWDNRGTALLTQVIAHNADIVCLQEVEHDHWLQDIRDTLAEQGYAGVYKKQTGDSSHGCAILYKTSKLQQVKSIPVEFLKGGILDRHNIGLILLLQPCQQVYGGKVEKICVATTHLLFNPRRGDVKLAQLMVLLAEIDKHAYLDDQPESGQCEHKCCPVNDTSKHDQEYQSVASSHQSSPEIDQVAGSVCEPQLKNPAIRGSAGYCPIILCGDFNSEPMCELYQFLTTGYLKYEDCIARLLCGQEEGRWAGTDRLVDRKLLPAALNICETCQYLPVLKQRHNMAAQGRGRLLPKVNSGQVWHGMNFQSVYSHFVSKGQREISTYHNSCCCTVDYIFYSQTAPRRGHLTLRAGLENGDSRAAHVDGSQSDMQQSTRDNSLDAHTDMDMTAHVVDMDRPTFKEPLELLARYRLLTKNEVTKYGFMPNSVFPSDHLCLIAKFVLR